MPCVDLLVDMFYWNRDTMCVYFFLENPQQLTGPMQVPARTSSRDNMTLMAFSVLYTVNIAISNVSLQLVTVPVCLCSRALYYGHA